MSFAVGALVRARNREWVVLPESSDDLLIVRPLGGTDDEVTGICLPLETVEPASFDLPDPNLVGDWRSCRLLRDAVRLGFRSSAGPFRSFAKIAVEPRPYQLVPLLVALKQNPIRMMIADDVGIGKTIEAVMIARELIDRGEIQRMAVLCPPHLAEQWQGELRDKFHIDATLVLPSTVTRLERECITGQSLFDIHPFVIVSIDFIKSDRRRPEFLRACPEFVIVDEAHACAFGHEGRGGRQQRHQLLKELGSNPDRHLLLVTATPHSGKEEEFRSLLGLIKPEFANLPQDLSGKENEPQRRKLAAHFIQRRRADIRHYMNQDTPFPTRKDSEQAYSLTPEYKRLFNKALRYASELVEITEGGQHRRRVRWWSALALLRSLASSPAAAAATLRARANVAETETAEEADELGRRAILDQDTGDGVDFMDVAPGSDIEEAGAAGNRRKLLEMAREADSLFGEKDAKVIKAADLIKGLVNDGFRPIVFCRFIPTAEYLAEYLRKRLPKDVEVVAVTGLLPPSDREERIEQLAKSPRRVLVSTDCLSEGVNLQHYFDAVFHYDLCWNPTRHEQREGRVDRFGQLKPEVRVLTYFGTDNQIDGLVLDVIIEKHKKIKTALGVTIPVPADTNTVIEALYQGLLLRGRADGFQYTLGFEEGQKQALHAEWDNATAREKRSRTVFAQESIKTEEVARELKEAQEAIGSGVDVEGFAKEAFSSNGALVSTNGVLSVDLREAPLALREAVGNIERFKAKFQHPVPDDAFYLNRTHPVVEGLASFVMNATLDPKTESRARRCGAVRTNAVDKWTTLLLLRLRYHIVKTVIDKSQHPLLAEDCLTVAFTGTPDKPKWIDPFTAEALLQARVGENIGADQARDFIEDVVRGHETLKPYLEEIARRRGKELLDAHQRVRSEAGIKGVIYSVEPHLPVDVLGTYVFLPVN